MEKKGKVIQIINNREINLYILEHEKEISGLDKDIVVLRNPEYPKGFKGFFLSFKKNKPERIFPILMDSKGIKEGDILKVNCDIFYTPTEFYIEGRRIRNDK
jgi:hypothetical protein